MPTPVPQFPQRSLFSNSSPQPTALQIIRRVAERESPLEIRKREETAQAPEAAEDDSTSDARSTFKQRTNALQEQIQALSFASVEDLSRANELLASVLSLKDDIERYHEPIKRPLKEAHAAACKAEHDDLDRVIALEKKLKQGIAALDVKLRQLETEAARVRQQAAAEAGSVMQQQMIEAARQSGASEEMLASLGAMEILVPVVETESFSRPQRLLDPRSVRN
jgi:hypothetical protein